MNIYEQMKELLEGLEPDVTKFYEKGNKTAGTRIRKTMQEMKKLAQDLRLDVQEAKKNS